MVATDLNNKHLKKLLYVNDEATFIAFLEKFEWSKLFSQSPNPIANTVKLMDLFGNPQYEYKVVHVAGSKGKGSVSCMLSAIFCDTGAKVGLFTSPHITSYRERIKINNKPVEDALLFGVVNTIIDFINDGEIALAETSTFEILTTIAFECFKRAEVDFAIVEVGLGGRWDSTNVVKPIACVITPIELEHCRILGDTIEKVASEKCGIIKPNAAVFSSNINGAVVSCIKKHCEDVESECTFINDIAQIENVKIEMSVGDFGTKYVNTFNIVYNGNNVGNNAGKNIKVETNLLGMHQAENAALALLVAWHVLGYAKVNVESLKNVEILCRTEVFTVNSNGKSERIIMLDGCHTEKSVEFGANAFLQITQMKQIAGNFGESAAPKALRERRKVVVFSCLKGKGLSKMLPHIAGITNNVVLCESTSLRCESVANIALEIEKYCKSHLDKPKINIFYVANNNPQEAVKFAMNNFEDTDIMVCGSLYLVAEVRDFVASVSQRLSQQT